MPLLVWIILFTAVGGIASAAFAGVYLLLPESTGQRLLPHFISYATGALLGAALLALLPDAVEGVGREGAHSIGLAMRLRRLRRTGGEDGSGWGWRPSRYG